MKGAEFTHNLKKLTNCKDFFELSELLDVPKSTFSTWNSHDRTSHELMVRLSLALNIPLEQLALKPESRQTTSETPNYTVSQHKAKTTPQHQTVIVKSFCLSGGKLIDTGEIPYPVRRINSLGLQQAELIEVETNEAIYLLYKSMTDALRGNYLINIDGHLSINRIQRLPGKKLAIAFDDNTIEVSDEDIQVVGYIAATLKKE